MVLQQLSSLYEVTSVQVLLAGEGVLPSALQESLPQFTEKDLIVVHRKNDKGSWKDEVWTARDFEALELQLGPCASQLKDSHLTAASHVVLGLPKHGRGAHPEGQALNLDGRGNLQMALKGSINNDQDLTGCLFWVVTRTSEKAEANLVLEPVTWEQKVSLNLPTKKKQKTSVEWGSSELPSIPVLVNKKAISKHTKLAVFLKEPAKKKDGA